jgi:hypothetical protein
MDQLLEAYEKVRIQDRPMTDWDAFNSAVTILKTLLWWAADHLCTKQNSDRREAVLRLASAVWTEHNRLAKHNRCGLGGVHRPLAPIE